MKKCMFKIFVSYTSVLSKRRKPLTFQHLKPRSALFWDITRRRVVIVFLLGLLAREDGTDTLSRNVGKQLPYDAA